MELSESYPFDHVLITTTWRARGRTSGLAAAGLSAPEESARLVAALDEIESEFDRGVFVRAGGDEDIHTAIERRATEIAGDVGAKIHTARSRNDQVATTLRLFLRDEIASLSRRSWTWSRRSSPRATASPDARLRATRTSSGPSPCSCPITSRPTPGRCCATWTDCWTRATG